MQSRKKKITGVPLRRPELIAGCVLTVAVLASRAYSQTTPPAADVPLQKETIAPPVRPLPPKDDVYNMSLEDLMNVQVSSVSKMLQNISQAPAAVTVIDSEQMHRSGLTSIPEILRLVPGLDVARVSSSTWAVSSRGFNNNISDKLLVLMDGRTIYDPLFAGVFWDAQDYLLPDLDKIEVIRGSGATLWGSNAVNGVINITTKSARDTQGGLIDAMAGTLDSNFGIRYGGKIDPITYYRVYGKFRDTSAFPKDSGGYFTDGWEGGQGGFRIDRYPDADTTLTLQGDFLSNTLTKRQLSHTTIIAPDTTGGNLLARWTHVDSPESGLSLQIYYDHSDRDALEVLKYQHDTIDIDFQQHFALGSFQMINWGASARVEHAAMDSGRLVTIAGGDRSDYTATTFVQDDLTLLPKHLHLILGSRFEYSSYSEFQVEPSARILFTPNEQNTFWAAVSRAVRTPSVSDLDEISPLGAAPGTLSRGNPNIRPEVLRAYEFGYRSQPTEKLTLDLAAFYNQYSRLTADAPLPNGDTTIVNGGHGHTYGLELAANYKVNSAWRLSSSYTYFFSHVFADPKAELDTNNDTDETPKQQVQFHSYYDLTKYLELNASCYYVGRTEGTSDNTRFDVGLNWKVAKGLEIGINAQNLLQGHHVEFTQHGFSEPVPRSVYIHLSYSF